MGKKRRRKSKGVAAEAAAETQKPEADAGATVADEAIVKKSKASTEHDAEAPAASLEAATSNEAAGSHEANKKSSVQTDSAEAERIANQKKLQKMVIRMRQRGKSEKEIRKAKIAFKRDVNMRRRIADPSTEARANPKPKKMTKREQHVAEWKERNQTEAQMKGKKHNIVIVPVLWRHKEDESSDILAACATIKKYLSSFGLDVWIDERTKYVRAAAFLFHVQCSAHPSLKDNSMRHCNRAGLTAPFCLHFVCPL